MDERGPPSQIAARASGKRRRKPRCPDSWASSILTVRSKVLCLGMSYPSVKDQIKEGVSSKVKLFHVEHCVEQAVELVRRNALTEMDGRDLARCLALEASNQNHAYTVSMERGAIYGPRHLSANFCRGAFVKECKKQWGRNIKFKQIILDYFWIPSGSWQNTHWNRSLFDTTIPNFVKEGLLEFTVDENNEANTSENVAVVYLPFCLHCVKQIVGALDILSKYYTIEFLSKHDLGENILWATTRTIDPDTMQNWLGKSIDQEETYCTFRPNEVMSSMEDEYVRKEDVREVINRIVNFDDIRMIKLKALQIHNPTYVRKVDNTAGVKKRKKSKLGINKGGFIGLAETGIDENPGNRTKNQKKKRPCEKSTKEKVHVHAPNRKKAKLKLQKENVDSSSLNEKNKHPRKKAPSSVKRGRKKVKGLIVKEETALANNRHTKKQREDYSSYFTESQNESAVHTISEPSEESVASGESDNEDQVESSYKIELEARKEAALLLFSMQDAISCDSITEHIESSWPRTYASKPIVLSLGEATEKASWIEMFLDQKLFMNAYPTDPSPKALEGDVRKKESNKLKEGEVVVESTKVQRTHRMRMI